MKNILKLISLLLICLSANAQNNKLSKGNKQYDEIAYIDAIKTYERVAKRGFKSVELFQKLGNSYYFNGKLKEANKWYTELFALNEELESEYYYRFSQTLKAVGHFIKADQYLDKFHGMETSDIRGNLYEKHKDYRKVIERNSGRYQLKPIEINSNVSDYGVAFYGEDIIFSTARDSIDYKKAPSRWTNTSFTNLYRADKNDDGSLQNPKRLSNTVNSKFNESTPVFTKDFKTVYFTRNNFNEGKTGYDKDKLILLKLYKANLENGEWVNIEELPFNDDNYNVAHPALSPDEKTLYFASNMPGTKGQSDIFKVDILEDGTYGDPINVEGGINTEGRETFPFVTSDNELYFASDGHPGLGGLDIFVSKFSDKGVPGVISNVGTPVNGPLDDFAFIINFKTKKGYFSSNREGGKGLDDIYFLKEKKELILEYKHELEVAIADSETGEALSNAKITLLDEKLNVLKETTSDDKGYYNFEVVSGKKYFVKTEKDGYETKEESIIVPNAAGKSKINLRIGKLVKNLKYGTDLGKSLEIKNIWFDIDRSDIREDAKIELAVILSVMQEYPRIKIEVRSHTDSRQTAIYNQTLSQKRADATVNWLISNGIDSGRLIGRGLGESQPVNKCLEGVECTEEEHGQNRRSEFIIIGL